MALLNITDASGRRWQYRLSEQAVCTIGRAPDNSVVLDDPRASRYHAYVECVDGAYVIVDGRRAGATIQRSANKVLVDGQPFQERVLKDGAQITIGTSVLGFEALHEEAAAAKTPGFDYDDQRLGHTQVRIEAGELMGTRLKAVSGSTREEVEALRRKADILALLYEMSQTLGSVFDLDLIFEKATDIIFRVTPADRVVALLADEQDEEAGGDDDDDGGLRPVAMRLRDEKLATRAKSLTIGRTITRKVMRERVALLSQDAAADEQFAGVNSIIAQGVRSTMCAPLVAESGVHGALYADRLDEFTSFTRDDLELLCAISAQTAVAVENVRAHRRLAREEVARANYGRFMPEYVVRQMLENPDSFKLGGVNQVITVLFADVRGFTSFAEHAPPEQVVQLLNRYFSAMSDIIFAHNGTLDKYIGDGLMALFGAPTATPQDAANAVAVAVQMQRRMKHLNAEFRAEGLQEISIGTGLHTGEATVGYIGSERRTEYTAIGDTVNTASRLESNTRGGQILLSEATLRAIPEGLFPVQQHEPLTVKNRAQPVQVYEVLWQQGEDTGSLG
ncbi:MAG TPA: adenylate/guanylate cyclase domain-containing protein [Pyrinomonadaceae bacterium]|nr:adenylate/guanylate cyclase domain-containing protein [Pyrinomonadaceae bacterium]